MLEEDKIWEVFNDAIAERIAQQKKGKATEYLDGLTAGLGWVLEEYDENPMG